MADEVKLDIEEYLRGVVPSEIRVREHGGAGAGDSCLHPRHITTQSPVRYGEPSGVPRREDRQEFALG